MDFLALLRKTGFAEAEMAAETGFNSSPVTRGVTFRARKLALTIQGFSSSILRRMRAGFILSITKKTARSMR
jgi:hypothetical protein